MLITQEYTKYNTIECNQNVLTLPEWKTFTNKNNQFKNKIGNKINYEKKIHNNNKNSFIKKWYF